MSNLKVNAKSTILEFKRKHNLLVDGAVVKITVSNIQSLTNEQLNELKCGDVVCKEDSTGKHSYIVTFKKDNVGICLSYFDGSGYIETVSYDYTNGNWVYNSTDVFNGGEIPNVEDAQSGTIQDVLGLNSSGKLVKGSVSGGTQLYKHKISIRNTTTSSEQGIIIVSSKNTEINSMYRFYQAFFSGKISEGPNDFPAMSCGDLFYIYYESKYYVAVSKLELTPSINIALFENNNMGSYNVKLYDKSINVSDGSIVNTLVATFNSSVWAFTDTVTPL